jgi:hypothetical protein
MRLLYRAPARRGDLFHGMSSLVVGPHLVDDIVKDDNDEPKITPRVHLARRQYVQPSLKKPPRFEGKLAVVWLAP